MGKTLLLFKSLLMSVCTLTLTTQAQSLSDVTNINVDECYIYDSFLSADWGNESYFHLHIILPYRVLILIYNKIANYHF